MQRAEVKEKVITQTFDMIKNRCGDMKILEVLWRIVDNIQYFDKEGWAYLDKVVREKCGQAPSVK